MFIVSSPRRVKIEWLSASRKLQRSSRDCCEIRLPPGTREERAEVFGVIGQHKRKGGKLPFGNCCELLSSRKTLETSNCQAQKNLFPELAARRTRNLISDLAPPAMGWLPTYLRPTRRKVKPLRRNQSLVPWDSFDRLRIDRERGPFSRTSLQRTSCAR